MSRRPGRRARAPWAGSCRGRPTSSSPRAGGRRSPAAGPSKVSDVCTQPRKMSLAACISRWPATTRSPWFEYSLLPRYGSSTDCLRLLDLQEERVVAVAAEQQQDPAPRPDAADPDDLACQVDHPELLEQVPAVLLQRPAVFAEEPANHALEPLERDPGLLGEVRRPARSTEDRRRCAARRRPAASASRRPSGCPSSGPSPPPSQLRRPAVSPAVPADSARPPRRRGARTRRRGWTPRRGCASTRDRSGRRRGRPPGARRR